MNHALRHWTRSVAFQLTLTEQAITDLLEMHAWEQELLRRGKSDLGAYAESFSGRRSAAGYLTRRGLAFIESEHGSYLLTKAGRLTAKLLLEAGFAAPKVASVFLEDRNGAAV